MIEKRLLCETVFKRRYVEEGKITEAKFNASFAIIAASAKGSESVLMVGKGGLEPPRLSTPDPKSGPSANSGTPPDVKSREC